MPCAVPPPALRAVPSAADGRAVSPPVAPAVAVIGVELGYFDWHLLFWATATWPAHLIFISLLGQFGGSLYNEDATEATFASAEVSGRGCSSIPPPAAVRAVRAAVSAAMTSCRSENSSSPPARVGGPVHDPVRTDHDRLGAAQVDLQPLRVGERAGPAGTGVAVDRRGRGERGTLDGRGGGRLQAGRLIRAEGRVAGNGAGCDNAPSLTRRI